MFLIVGMFLFPLFLNSRTFENMQIQYYNMECSILRVLRMAKFDPKVTDGWMTLDEIHADVVEVHNEKFNWKVFETVLQHLIEEGAVLHGLVPVACTRSKPFENGFIEACKHNKDSGYRSKRPKKRPKKEKQEGLVDAHI